MLGLKDIIISPLFILLIYIAAFILWKIKFHKTISFKLFNTVLVVKLLGAIGYGLLYQFYYSSGDTFDYFKGGNVLYQLINDKAYNQAFYFISEEAIKQRHLFIDFAPKESLFLSNKQPFFMVKITGIISLATFNTYLPTAMLLSFFSFSGLIALFHFLVKRYNHFKSNFFLSLFFVPSIILMGSGLMKDTITLGCLCWASIAYFKILERKFLFGLWPIILLFSFYFIYYLKAYILYAFIPAAFMATYIYGFNLFKSLQIKLLYFTLSSVALIGVMYYTYTFKMEWITEKIITNLISSAEGYQTWHNYLAETQSQSGYTLGEIDFTLLGILKKIPAGINVSLFRPYIFEVKNILMLFSSIEALFTLVLTVYFLIKVGFIKIIKSIFSDPFLMFLIVYSLVFLFAVGFTTYNFGALMRYKIPGFLFYLLFIDILLKMKRTEKALINAI